ncbi:MAG: glycosyltransferase family 4 protein [Candidatus Acidiferrales bacterium]
MTRLLYILTGPVPPSSDPAYDKFHHLSEIAEGEVLLPVWWDSHEKVAPFLRETFPVYRVGNFRYHLFVYLGLPKILQRLAAFLFYLRCGLRLHREKKFDVIVTYGTNRTGIAAVILKWITGAKLIVELSNVPEDAFRYDVPDPGIFAPLKRFLADQFLNIVCSNADCMKLLYPSQLRNYPRLNKKKVAVFHDFVPVHAVRPGQSDERFILLVGHPWYTKGVDVLIRAFELIAAQFPDFKLKLLGYNSDREYRNTVTRRCPQIVFLKPITNDAALQVIGACSVYVLASRSESMGRVLLEAMAARKPIVASAVGGVPHYVADNENGLLFQSEDAEELAEKLATLLTNPELQARLAKKGYEKVFSEYDEKCYVRSFSSMLESLRNESVGRHGRSDQHEGMIAATKTANS